MNKKLIPKHLNAWLPLVYLQPINPEVIEKTLEMLLYFSQHFDELKVKKELEEKDKQEKKEKRLQNFSNVMHTIAMGENAPVMTALGYGYDENGNIGQYYVDDPGVKALRNNLTVLGGVGSLVLTPLAVSALAPFAGEALATVPTKAAADWAITKPILTNAGKEIAFGMGMGSTANAFHVARTGKTWELDGADRYLTWMPEGIVKDFTSGLFNPFGYLSLGHGLYFANGLDNTLSKLGLYGKKLLIPKTNSGLLKASDSYHIPRDIIIDEKSLQEFAERPAPMNMFLRRLNSGGYEKIGITDDSYTYIPIGHRLNRFLKSAEPVPNNPEHLKVNVKEFIDKLMSRKPNEIGKSSYYSPLDQDIFINPEGFYESLTDPVLDLSDVIPGLLDNLKNVTKAHEIYHALDAARFALNSPIKLNSPEFVTAFTRTHEAIPGVDYTKAPHILAYFQDTAGTEMKARFSQLRDFYGISDTNQPLTIKLWNHAKKHYPYDNNMREFFDVVVDPEKFLEYMNKVVPISVGVGLLSNKNDLNEQKTN